MVNLKFFYFFLKSIIIYEKKTLTIKHTYFIFTYFKKYEQLVNNGTQY